MAKWDLSHGKDCKLWGTEKNDIAMQWIREDEEGKILIRNVEFQYVTVKCYVFRIMWIFDTVHVLVHKK